MLSREILQNVKGVNPYTLPAGRELDRMIGEAYFPSSQAEELPFSTNEGLAQRVRGQLQTKYGHRVAVGKTKVARKPFFARFESGPSSSTEVLAETLPLAICRLAALVHSNYTKNAPQ